MKLEIWEKPEVVVEEKVTYLRLLPGPHSGAVDVVAVDKATGEDIGGGIVAVFGPKGLERRKHLTSGAGFALDDHGLIKELEPY